MILKLKNLVLKNKNLSLFALLILGLVATYFFEEKSNLDFEEKASRESAVLDVAQYGELTGLKGLKLDFIKDGEQYFTKDKSIILSKKKVDEVFEILSKLKVKSFISDNDIKRVGRLNYIPDDKLKLTFQFKKGELTFVLGSKLNFDQTFYMEIIKEGKSTIAIINDESPDPGTYTNDKDYQKSEAKYKRLQMVFMIPNSVLYDTRVIKNNYEESKINFKEIKIATFRNKSFKVNFEKTETIPPVLKGLKYFDENWISFHRFLTNLEAQSIIYPIEPGMLNEILSHLEIIDRNGIAITLDLYKKYGETIGYFLTSSLDNNLYVLKAESARYFFVNIQDFWKKSVAPLSKDFELSITSYDGQTEKVRITDGELFKVQSVSNKLVRPLIFKKLIDFLKSESDHVAELTEKPSDIVKKKVLDLSYDNRKLSVILEENDAIVLDWDNKIKFHYYIGASVPFSIKNNEYFELKK